MTPPKTQRTSGNPARTCEFFLTSYMLGGPDGRNLGAPGYSHEFVARLFRPLLERIGPVREIRDARRDLQPAVDDCLRRGQRPVHFSVLPFQDVTFARDAVNVVMPAWEFPDVPNEGFDGNPQNDWPATANRCDLVIVSGPFTENSLVRGGTMAPIQIVPVPTPDGYFAVPAWQGDASRRIGCPAYVFDHGIEPVEAPPPAQRGRLKACERTLRDGVRRLLGNNRYERLSSWLKMRRHVDDRQGRRPELSSLPYPRTDDLELSGVVYTSIFNPDDGRKNWADLLTAWLAALADRADATLVCKLITKRAKSVRKVIEYFRAAAVPRRCRVVFICEFLSDEQMLELCRASTFYVQATKAEGNCLPLMNYLAAGRPGISPDHSSMGDYFGAESGFVVESHPEPAAWPHDRRLRPRTTWGRLVWPSLRDRIGEAYRLAKESPREYAALSISCRDSMRSWAGTDAVVGRLDAALGEVLGTTSAATVRATPEIPPARRAA